MGKRLVIYGDSDYAEMIAHYFQSDSPYEVVGFCVDAPFRSRERIGMLDVVVTDEVRERFSPETHAMFLALGYAKVRVRKRLFERMRQWGYAGARYVASRAMVDETAHIGDNCLILPGAIVEPHATLEHNVFVNSGAIVSHHALIGAHSVLAAGSLVGGYSRVGEASLIGFHATVAELLTLGEETLVGAGSVVLENVAPHTMVVGAPARAVRTHKEHGIVLVE